jgi:hypothetical protein
MSTGMQVAAYGAPPLLDPTDPVPTYTITVGTGRTLLPMQETRRLRAVTRREGDVTYLRVTIDGRLIAETVIPVTQDLRLEADI